MSEDNLRAEIVRIAKAEAGQGLRPEYLADAAPQFVGSRPSWCGIFALWVLRRAGVTVWQWETGKGFLYRLPQTSLPKPGDIAYYDAYQHQAIVSDILPGGNVELVNGNGQNGLVTISTRPISDARAYFSVEPLLRANP